MRKEEIRRQLLAERQSLDEQSYYALSSRVQDFLIHSACFEQAERLALYSPVRREVATDAIFTAALESGKQVYYPKVVGNDLEFHELADLGDLVPGTFSVPEPNGDQIIDAGLLDLIVVPGVAFDLTGQRLGYGRGYYDRFLAQAASRAVFVGLCFEFQLQNFLPAEIHDWKMMFLATETGFIPCRDISAGSL